MASKPYLRTWGIKYCMDLKFNNMKAIFTIKAKIEKKTVEIKRELEKICRYFFRCNISLR